MKQRAQNSSIFTEAQTKDLNWKEYACLLHITGILNFKTYKDSSFKDF